MDDLHTPWAASQEVVVCMVAPKEPWRQCGGATAMAGVRLRGQGCDCEGTGGYGGSRAFWGGTNV